MRSRLAIVVFTAALLMATSRCHAQVLALTDDLPVLAKGQREQTKHQTSTQLGPTPGAGGSIMRGNPSAGEALLRGLPSPGAPQFSTVPERRNVLSAAARPAGTSYGFPEAPPENVPAGRPASPSAPTFAQLEIPEGDDAGPPNGLTLDRGLDLLVRQNGDLQAKYHEIPAAQADILTASLRANPIVFASADGVPYGSYSPERPGENGYGATVVQPLDVSGSRKARMQVAHRARHVLEAQYQDAVRLQVDSYYTTFIDVLAAREAVRYAQASLENLDVVLKTTQDLHRKGLQLDVEVDRARTQRDSAELGWQEATVLYAQAIESLALLLNIPAHEVDGLQIRGALRGEDPDQPIPTTDELIGIALCERPDLNAFRLGVQRAQADVRLARAEATPEVFMLYTPYNYRNNQPTGGQSMSSWGLGGMATVPLYNRNQGNIRRAQINVAQTGAELAALERQVVAEVRRARLEYDFTERAMQRVEKQILPQARHWRDDKFKLYSDGKEDFLNYLSAHRDYIEVVRQYRETAVRHRRSMLKLNTVVGQRILP